MRVSDSKRYDVVADRVNNAKTQNEKLLGQISTQKRINALEDDPLGFSTVISLKNDSSNKRQFQRNIDFGKGYLENTEAAVTTLSDKLIRAKELAIGMANDTYAQGSRDAVSKEIDEIMNEIMSLGNASFNNRYLFSGFRTRTPAFASEGEFVGDDGQIFLPIGRNDFRQVNIPGRLLFEPNADERASGHMNLLESLRVLRDGLEANDKETIHNSIDEMDFHLEKVTSTQATIGAMHSSLQKASERLLFEEEQTEKMRSTIEDADIYRSSSDFKKSESVLQSTLLTSNKLLQPSLLNFMQ
ncbi:MAG: flagellar hook-associated protein FlgL [Oligoflexales bacterium]|nr:flagellar hook-associated protein FlgL [Oligoflexales bacterium]